MLTDTQVSLLKLLVVAISVDENVDSQTRIMAKAFLKSFELDLDAEEVLS